MEQSCIGVLRLGFVERFVDKVIYSTDVQRLRKQFDKNIKTSQYVSTNIVTSKNENLGMVMVEVYLCPESFLGLARVGVGGVKIYTKYKMMANPYIFIGICDIHILTQCNGAMDRQKNLVIPSKRIYGLKLE